MTRFIQWTGGLITRIDTMIAQVENHDELAASAIRQIQRSLGRARSRLQRLVQEGQRLDEELTELEQGAERWRDRAQREADDDRALGCLRRSKQARAGAETTRKRIAAHRAIESDLKRDLTVLEERLMTLRHQRQAFQVRQSRAEAASLLGRIDDSTVDDIFERWEMRLSCAEAEYESPAATDSFAEQFDREEEESALRQELDALRRAQ